MSTLFDVVLLLALPASGKSEVRKYLASLDEAVCRDQFSIGPTVQLDDFPYVHLMRRVDEELVRLNHDPAFFLGPDRTFIDPWDWGTLVQLMGADFEDVTNAHRVTPTDPACFLLERIDAAACRAGARIKLSVLDEKLRHALYRTLERDAHELLRDKNSAVPPSLEDRTVVIEFARGGANGAHMPLAAPFGYAHSLAQLPSAVLERAVVLYVWVTPEESRRKNEERADPNDPGSILHHRVPLEVMLGDYGCDDIGYLLDHSGVPDTIPVENKGQLYQLPLARFDNRSDRTSFLRKPREAWGAEEVSALHEGLAEAFAELQRVNAARQNA